MIVSNAITEVPSRAAVAKEGARLHPGGALHAVEGFLIERLRFVAIAVSCVILGVCAMTVYQGARSALADDTLTGSIIIPARVGPSIPADAWRPVRRPMEIIALQAAQVERLPSSYSAHRRGDERRDTLAFGHFEEARPDVGVALLRNAAAWRDPMIVEAARRQSERGVSIDRRSQPEPLPTKFGTLDVSEAAFSGEGQIRKACLVFRSTQPVSGIGIEGWFCAAPGTAAERPALACMIDRLAVLKAGEDVALRSWFQEAEKRRQPCPSQQVSGGRKPTWMDQDGKRPAIRGDDVTGSIRRERPRN
jgi:hypothetical protein